ncbi:MAG: flagellar hook-associated protein FlgL [Methylococcaceae bacterium]|nr:flagellar hook-associated protein FlgL [Methylococcaceae bacterium]MDZ4156964.1 flagellar hook-associated protein FlgL [Methylococcales bacterium]MDP2393988.1 flagellar hook-associated protein FlgL [Methylococcaceae bacterium]MDP3018548.1 flagellar hook-associated protein FlgL [Methylococcaceae bacterium]MDP3391303.1 flagellar hook-associated protein FlgL [Methylococcaceae bacterium]
MRISTAFTQQTSLSSLLDQQAKMNKTQMQLSSGKKNLTPADDPMAAAKVVDLNQTIKQTEQYQSNINSTRQRLGLADGVLQSAVDLMHKVKDLGVQGLNGSNSPSDRIAIATEMRALNEQLAGLANTQNANGEYIFSGFNSNQPSFTETAPGSGLYSYGGSASGPRVLQISADRQMADGDLGTSVFGTPGVDSTLEAIDKFATAMKNNTPSAASLDDLKTALDKIITTQSSVGVRLNTLDRQEENHLDYAAEMTKVLSDTEDLDYASAISKFNLQNTSLQAAQQSFAKVQNLSLFKYL